MLTAEKRYGPLNMKIMVWLAHTCEDGRFRPAQASIERTLRASAFAGHHFAGLTYVNQYVSGGSFVACLEGKIAPAPGNELVLRIGIPPVPDLPGAEAELLAAIISGVEAVAPERRPCGTLELTRFLVHTTDFKPHRWKVAASLLCGLLGPTMTALLAANGSAAELWAAFEESVGPTDALER